MPNRLKAYICLLITISTFDYNVLIAWKESQVKLLSKQSKNREEAKIKRPISFKNCFAKPCKTDVKGNVLSPCQNNSVFSKKQSAYKRNHCTTDNLLKLSQRITEAYPEFEMVEFLCLITEDAKGFIDMLRVLWFLNKLQNIKCKAVIK